PPLEYGRIAAQSAKQVIVQKVREAERDRQYAEYKDRIGEIIHADVHQVNRRGVILNIERTEFIMPPREQVRSERYYRGSALRVLIKDVVRENNKDPEIIVSRSDPNFIRRLFEVEVPEISEGIIQIKAIARVPGRRTKIAVESNDPRIDPVGSCVGMKGVRIQAIVRELDNEKIDIINYSSDAESFIKKAMSPNKPLIVSITGMGSAVVVLNEEEYAKMVERQQRRWETREDIAGEFVFNPMDDMVFRLAQEITGFSLTLVNESDHLAAQLHQEQIEEDLKIVDVAGINDVVAGKLIDGGYFLAERLLDDATETITEKTGLTAEEIGDIRRRVAAYFQDIKISDVADLPKAYKDALITGGYHNVEEYLGARAEEIAERTGLDPQDLEEVTRILSAFDTQVEDEE
ncbi:MAG: transcription termination/antitermination protein NusA, partial [Candidatus Cloacimonetes bacterium]|nr:transcription termination/antitermination protein NusA [Candidatus Cloacimonadota bacterium]